MKKTVKAWCVFLKSDDIPFFNTTSVVKPNVDAIQQSLGERYEVRGLTITYDDGRGRKR